MPACENVHLAADREHTHINNIALSVGELGVEMRICQTYCKHTWIFRFN